MPPCHDQHDVPPAYDLLPIAAALLRDATERYAYASRVRHAEAKLRLLRSARRLLDEYLAPGYRDCVIPRLPKKGGVEAKLRSRHLFNVWVRGVMELLDTCESRCVARSSAEAPPIGPDDADDADDADDDVLTATLTELAWMLLFAMSILSADGDSATARHISLNLSGSPVLRVAFDGMPEPRASFDDDTRVDMFTRSILNRSPAESDR